MPTGKQVPNTGGDTPIMPPGAFQLVQGWQKLSDRRGGWLILWKRKRDAAEGPSPEVPPSFPQISFFSLLSVLCVMLSMAGSVLSCKNAQLARDFRECSMVRFEEGDLGRRG